MPTHDPDTTKELTEVISDGRVTPKAVELETEDDLASRMDDNASGIASLELGEGGPREDDGFEPLPHDIRADHIEREEFDTDLDADLTDEEQDPDLRHLDGNLRGAGDSDLHALRNGGERAAAVADEKVYRPDGPVTAAPKTRH